MGTVPQKGYRLSYDATRHIIKSEGWGFWDDELAKQYSQDFKALIQKNVMDNQPWYILADLRNLAVQKQEVQHVIGELMSSIKTHGLKKSASLVSKALTKMQLKRMAKESGNPEESFFHTEDDAIQWLLT